MKKLIAVLSLFSVLSCNSSKDASKIEKSKENQSGNRWEILAQSDYQGRDKKEFLIVRNQSELDNLYSTINSEQKPNVDFTKSQVVALFLGQKNSGGHSIGIENVEETSEEITIKVKTNSPKSGEIVTMALTNPYCVAKINSTKKIKFVE